MTLRGLLGECSASPISSKYIIDIILSKLSLLFFKRSLAFLKIFNTPLDVDPKEPWNELIYNLGKDLNTILSEASPFIAPNKS